MQAQTQIVSRINRVFSKFAPPKPRLIEAASRGDSDVVARLVANGTDVNVQDHRGRTALHEAARRKHYGLAAWLLASGASHEIRDKSGRTALQLKHIKPDALHRIRQHYKRRSFTGDTNAPAHASAQTVKRLRELEHRGFLKLPGFVSREGLRQLQSDFAGFVNTLEASRHDGTAGKQSYFEEEHYWEEDAAYLTNNAFKHSAELARLSCHEDIVELANLYMRGQASITRAVAMRYLPQAERDNDMFGWHHDLEDKRFKIMILLTDLGPTDQVMSYVLGSHKLFHSHEMFFRNSCGLDYCKKHLGNVEVQQTIGQAGDVFVFDSNGIHRGNRHPNASVRDVFFVEYDTELANVWGGELAGVVSDQHESQVPTPLAKLVETKTKWDHPVERKHPTWIENLHHIDRWR